MPFLQNLCTETRFRQNYLTELKSWKNQHPFFTLFWVYAVQVVKNVYFFTLPEVLGPEGRRNFSLLSLFFSFEERSVRRSVKTELQHGHTVHVLSLLKKGVLNFSALVFGLLVTVYFNFVDMNERRFSLYGGICLEPIFANTSISANVVRTSCSVTTRNITLAMKLDLFW